jgi:hypothetical protein
MMGIEHVVQAQVETPKPPVGLYEMPCGYLDDSGELYTEIVVREITGGEEDMLVSKSVPNLRKMNELLIRCVERIGPYQERKDIIKIIPKLLVGDRVFLLFAVRRASLGDMFPFEEVCPKCDKKSGYMQDLSEMKIVKMPDPRKRIFDEVLPRSQKPVRFRPLTGADEERLNKALDGADSASAAILIRLELLDDKPPTMADVKKLGLQDRIWLRRKFDEAEGGVDTTMEVECPFCNHKFERDLQVDDPGFFYPSETQLSSSEKSSI